MSPLIKQKLLFLRRNFSIMKLLALLFIVNMLFFDENSVVESFRLNHRISNLERDIRHYKQVITESQTQLNTLQTDDKNLERFARERFHMKAPNEEVFLIEEAPE